MKAIKYIIYVLLLTIYCVNSYGQTVTNSISVTSSGSTISGTYSIWFGSYNSSAKIIKPFIICEGFDPLNNVTATDVYRYQVNYSRGFLTSLRNRNYDVIVLNLNNNTMEIEKNADLFIELIKTINNEVKNNNSNYRLNALGVSMGGLIVRYALAKMEKQGLDHRVENYISFDSPQLGANIPLGVQQMVDNYFGKLVNTAEWITVLNKLNMGEFTDKMVSFSTAIFGCKSTDFFSNLIKQLDYSAAFEMSSVYMHDNVWRQAYLNNLNSVGSMPAKSRNIAVSMGSNGSNQGYNGGVSLLNYSNNFTLVDYTLKLPWGLGSFGFKWTPLAINNIVNSMPGDASGRTFRASATIQPFINFPTIGPSSTYYSSEHDHLVAPTNCSIDNIPGAYLELPIGDISDWLKGTVTIPINLSRKVCIRIPFVGRTCATVGVKFNVSFKRSAILGSLTNGTGFSNPKFCFVPTLSALGINNSNWFANVDNIVPNFPYPKDKSITPFDAICYSKYNSYHATMPNNEGPGGIDDDDKVYTFLQNEICPDNLYIQNKTFSNSYSNVFEAQTITIGNNVDIVPNRSTIGDVISNVESKIRFRVPQNGSILLKPGSNLKGNILCFTDPDYYTSSTTKSTIIGNELNPLRQSKIYNETNTEANSAVNSNIEEYSDISITDDLVELKSATIENSIDFKISETKIEIYPNPIVNDGNIYLEIAEQTHIKIEILSTQGVIVRTVVDKAYSSGIYSESFNTTNLPKGIYMCNIHYNKGQKVLKILIK